MGNAVLHETIFIKQYLITNYSTSGYIVSARSLEKISISATQTLKKLHFLKNIYIFFITNKSTLAYIVFHRVIIVKIIIIIKTKLLKLTQN